MADDPPTGSRVGSLLSSITSVVAPLSLLTALLFYFGYASARAQYAYFGIDVDTIGLSTQDFVMRSPQTLLTPLLTLLLAGVVVTRGTAAVRRRVEQARSRVRDTDPDVRSSAHGLLERLARLARICEVAGWGLLVAGALLLAGYAVVGGWWLYPLLTPLLMALGAALALYALRIRSLLDRRPGVLSPAGLAFVAVLAVNLFWATATFAQWTGRGLAEDLALDLGRLPGVILDTQARLYLTSPGVRETELGPDAEPFRYRYRDLRLLIEGSNRLFLVPESWSGSNSTLVVPLASDVRIQFRFVNSPPGGG